jgi:hypothetical protein
MNLVFSLEITSDFKYCDFNNKNLVDIDNSCKLEESHSNVT